MKNKTLEALYNDMKRDREPYLSKAYEACRYSIPSLLKNPDLSKNTPATIVQPNQSVVTDGVNNLAAMLVLTMFPPNQTFFKFSMDDVEIERAAAARSVPPEVMQQDVNKGLALTEKRLLDYMAEKRDRVAAGEAMKHYIVCGNVLFRYKENDGLTYYPLTRYCIKRDYEGNPLLTITTETISINALPDNIKPDVIQKIIEKKGKDEKINEDTEVTLYTGYKLKRGKYITWQEVEGIKIESSEGSFPKGVMPFIALRYTVVDGESYGRGLIEDYIGDITYLDCLSKAIKEASLAGAKVIILVRPNSYTKIRDLAKAKSGDFVQGDTDDCQALQIGKYNDLSVAKDVADKIEKRLDRIFLKKTAIQRDAERVTAEEIRIMANALDETLGNQYTSLSKDFQKPYVRLSYYFCRKTKGKYLADLLNDKSITLTISTGLEALGRNSDLNKLVTFLEIMSKLAPQAQTVHMKLDVIAKAVATSLNINVEGFFYTPEELAQMQAQQTENDNLKAIAPNMINKLGDMMLKANENGKEKEKSS